MSVNEVLQTKTDFDLEIKGTGPEHSRTFSLGNEDHTIGNSLRHVLMQSDRVGFAGYSVPHPSEPVVQIRVQTSGRPGENEPPPAIDALKEACETLADQCAHIAQMLEDKLPIVKQDREKVEEFNAESAKRLAEMDAAEAEDEGEAMDVEE
mmetsp:Transcript_15607/g.34099  ORF Transcript_15607/g.34099 Transcript_15607/m.34099 type:complete len:151 (-) Transcript_15607:316-768(-)